MKSKACVRSKYDSSTVKYGKSKVPYGNFFLAPTVYIESDYTLSKCTYMCARRYM